MYRIVGSYKMRLKKDVPIKTSFKTANVLNILEPKLKPNRNLYLYIIKI